MKDAPRTQVEIDALPSILDVVEQISAYENRLALPSVDQIPPPEHLDEGRYSYVSERRNRSAVHLMPMSQSPYKYYRGQSHYYPQCVPALFRGKNGGCPTDVDIAANLIKVCEFELLLQTHPVYCFVRQNIMGNPVALAQHYGFATDYLDITNSKWVAAFFASTGYNWETDTYYPVGRDFMDGFGVMYVSKEFNMDNLPDEFFEKNGVIGYQYFERPTKQSSFGFGMSLGEDFNESPYFDKVFFRHDLTASKIVFDMSYRQNRFIPKDHLSKLARKIQVSDEVTRAAVQQCSKRYYHGNNELFLGDVCAQKGWKIREDNIPIAAFSEEDFEHDWKQWIEFGKADIEARTLPIIPITLVKK